MVQKLRRIRIAISGPNASGKTTLAKAIGGKYGIPVLEEALAPIFDAQSKLMIEQPVVWKFGTGLITHPGIPI